MLLGAYDDVRRSWRQLFLTDIAYKLVGVAILSPLLALTLQLFVSLSGNEVLADQDILFFALRPVGMIAIVVVSGVALTIIALEQACLMAIGLSAAEGLEVDLRSLFRFALGRARDVVILAVLITGRSLLWALPFLAAIGGIYLGFLGEYDINYYLSERPPEFLAALGLAAVVVAGLAAVLVPKLVGWAFALPLVLFESSTPRTALRQSRDRAFGHRGVMTAVLVGWGVAAFLLANAPVGLVTLAGRAVAPLARGSLDFVFVLMILLVALWLVLGVIATMVNAAAFALVIVRLYEKLAASPDLEAPRVLAAGADGGRGGLSLRGVLVGLVVAALVASAVGFVVMRRVRIDQDVLVIAHRGAAGAAPENTLAAVGLAVEENADFVEIDVQETADGEVVVFHDSDFMKTAGVDLKIWDASFAEAREIDIGSWFDAGFSQERVPTLAEVLERCKDGSKVTIELKYYGHDQRLEERVAEIVEAAGMEEQVILMSLDYDGVRKMKRLRPEWTVGLLAATAVGDLTELDADFLAVNAGMATRSFVRRSRAQGKDVYVWTINDPVAMARMAAVGVDGLITDEPALARSVLERLAELGTVERMLLAMSFFFGAEATAEVTEADA